MRKYHIATNNCDQIIYLTSLSQTPINNLCGIFLLNFGDFFSSISSFIITWKFSTLALFDFLIFDFCLFIREILDIQTLLWMGSLKGLC